MPKCLHQNVSIEATIEYRVTAQVGVVHVDMIGELPTSLRITVNCPECTFVNVFTAYPNRDDGHGWSRWPKWLLHRMQILRMDSAAIEGVLRALAFDDEVRF